MIKKNLLSSVYLSDTEVWKDVRTIYIPINSMIFWSIQVLMKKNGEGE